MKRIIVATILASILILAGCQGKGVSNTSSSSQAASRDTTQYNFKPVSPGTLPKLNQNQKSEINKKIDPAIKDVQNTLNNLQDTQDINLDSTN